MELTDNIQRKQYDELPPSYHIWTSRIQELSSLGFSNREIAKKLNRHHSSISRELRRNSIEGKYRGESAQNAYEQRRLNSVPAGKYEKTLCEEISVKLQATWSPEQISNTITAGKICFKTIYRWIYQGLLPDIDVNHLRHKGKRRKAEKRGKFSMGTPISQRPKEVKSRETFGHWELDLIAEEQFKSTGEIMECIKGCSPMYSMKCWRRSWTNNWGTNGTPRAMPPIAETGSVTGGLIFVKILPQRL